VVYVRYHKSQFHVVKINYIYIFFIISQTSLNIKTTQKCTLQNIQNNLSIYSMLFTIQQSSLTIFVYMHESA